MPEFGPYTRWQDPRLYDFANLTLRQMGGYQRKLLLGIEPWFARTWGTDRRVSSENLLRRLHDVNLQAMVTSPMGFRRCVSELTMREAGADTVDVHLSHHNAPLPPASPMLAEMVDQYDLRFRRVLILSLEGPVDTVEGVPIFRGAVMTRERSLQHGVYVVGCRLVGRLWQRGPMPEDVDICGRLREERSRIRTTLRQARHVAREIAAERPAWEAHQALLRSRAEGRRLAEEAAAAEAEPVDEDLAAFRG